MSKEIHILKHLFGMAIIAALPAIVCGCAMPMTDPGAVSGNSGGASGKA